MGIEGRERWALKGGKGGHLREGKVGIEGREGGH